MRLGDLARPKLDAIVFRDTKVPRRGLQSETFQFPRPHIVELHEEQRVDDMASVDLILLVLDQTLRDLQS